MSDEQIIKNMINYIEEMEKQIKAEKLSGGSAKNKVTRDILKKLEVEIQNADKESWIWEL